jgi:hypothetical protein
MSVLSHFRVEFYDCLYKRPDALFEPADAVLCADGPVTSLTELTLTAEHQRGHGAMYDAVNHGRLEPRRLRRLLASTPLPRAADGRIVLAVDVSNWLRPDAPASPDLLFCHVYGRGRNADQFIPGRPYSFVAALETGRTSWTAVLDAIRLGPADDATAVTAAQLRDVVTRLVHARQWKPGDAEILIVMDAGYDVTRLAHVLADLAVELVGRLRSDRVMLRDAEPRRSTPRGGQPRKNGGVLTFAKPDSWHTPDQTTPCDTTRCGTAEALAWDRMHPRLTAEHHRTARAARSGHAATGGPSWGSGDETGGNPPAATGALNSVHLYTNQFGPKPQRPSWTPRCTWTRCGPGGAGIPPWTNRPRHSRADFSRSWTNRRKLSGRSGTKPRCVAFWRTHMLRLVAIWRRSSSWPSRAQRARRYVLMKRDAAWTSLRSVESSRTTSCRWVLSCSSPEPTSDNRWLLRRPTAVRRAPRSFIVSNMR